MLLLISLIGFNSLSECISLDERLVLILNSLSDIVLAFFFFFLFDQFHHHKKDVSIKVTSEESEKYIPLSWRNWFQWMVIQYNNNNNDNDIIITNCGHGRTFIMLVVNDIDQPVLKPVAWCISWQSDTLRTFNTVCVCECALE